MPLIKRQKKRLMTVDLIHELPGRLRIRCGALKYLDEVKRDLVDGLLGHHHIQHVVYTPVTGSLLVFFDHTALSSAEILEIMEEHISRFALFAYEKEREETSTAPVSERRLQEESFLHILKRVAVSAGSLLLFGYVRTLRGHRLMGWKRVLLAPPAMVSIALSLPIFQSGLESLRRTGRPNADTLTSTAVITALLTGRSLSALVTILLADTAEMMTAYTMENTRKAIGDMLNVGDDDVFVLTPEGHLVQKPVSQVDIGETVSIQTGDKVSVDGIVTDGQAYIDESPITGEFFPVSKKTGEMVYAGTIVKSGQLRARVEHIGDDTTVARIVHMVENALGRKAQIQTYADRFSANLIPVNFGLAAIVYALTRDINRALGMLIIDFSCGVRLSTATALSACIHNAARNGVLIKGGNFVESMAEADSLILDKTGTITEGKPRVTSIHAAEGCSEKELLQAAAAAEEESSHPLAHAILDQVKRSGYTIPEHGMVEVVAGRGLTTTVDGERILIGNRRYMMEHGVDMEELRNAISSLEKKGEMIIYAARDSSLLGVIGIHDALKENMKKALNRLRNLGFDDVRLLTGDIAFQAEKVATRMHMDHFGAELMPEDKVKTVLEMQSHGAKVIMIGDGINDAPALAYADVGIAIGSTRTDVAIESANVTITNDDPLLIPSAVQLSRQTMSTVRDNFKMVVGINALGIVLSAVGWLPVVWGSVLHNSSTIFVVLNSGRLLFHDFRKRVLL